MAYINLLEIVYPVGSVYISTNATSPAEIIGGSWTKITGAILRAEANTANSYSGSDNHTLSIENMPRHNHGIDIWSSNWTEDIGIETNAVQWGRYTSSGVRNASGWSDGCYKGEGTAFSTLPRTYSIFCWVRTS